MCWEWLYVGLSGRQIKHEVNDLNPPRMGFHNSSVKYSPAHDFVLIPSDLVFFFLSLFLSLSVSRPLSCCLPPPFIRSFDFVLCFTIFLCVFFFLYIYCWLLCCLCANPLSRSHICCSSRYIRLKTVEEHGMRYGLLGKRTRRNAFRV